ncbi:MAG: phage tail protein [Endomicrobium sp.]|jgi:hypothetical protein|nr:phage tail protein [Endomicrobium sp.]
MKNLLFVLFILCLSSMFCYSEVPNEIRYSGRLKNYNSLVNASIDFNFKIYSQESGDTALWESGNQSIKVSSGLFSYVIKPDLNKVDLRKSNLWLQLVVDGKELTPREKLLSQLYSLHSLSAESLSANNEIVIKVGNSSLSITVKDGKLCYKNPQNSNLESLSVPPGTIIAFGGNRIPEGYLLCDGSEVEKSKYPQLFDAIGTIYGGNASSRFKLPDLRGMFLRGAGGSSASLGQKQGDAIRNIKGSFENGHIWLRKNGNIKPQGAFAYSTEKGWDNLKRSDGVDDVRSILDFDASIVVPVANENRPVNYAVQYCIKY